MLRSPDAALAGALLVAAAALGAPCAAPWSDIYPLVNSSSEAAPWNRCSGFVSAFGCRHKNFCCWDYSPSNLGCYPSNAAFIDCVGLSMGDCAGAASLAGCWWDGQNCRRGCPPDFNETFTSTDLCAALDTKQQPQPWSTFLAFNSLEWAPQKTCAQFSSSQGCQIQNYCCWVPSIGTCIPSNVQRIECPGRSQNSCQAYPSLCTWTGSQCARNMPQTSDANQLCSVLGQEWQVARNVLMIIVDDLRPELNLAYGQNNVITPNLDAFAARQGTVVFDRAFSNFPICSPSRSSFLSGRSPDTTGCTTQVAQLRSLPGSNNWITLPQLFKNNGFYSTGGGKIFHLGHDDPQSWNSYFFENVDQGTGCTDDPNAKPIPMRSGQTFQPAWAICTSSSGPMQFLDYRLLQAAVNQLQKFAQTPSQPFFMAVGFWRPHIPYQVADRFWAKYAPYYNTYDAAYTSGPQPENSYAPFFYDPNSDIAAFYPNLTPWTPLSLEQRLVLRTGYLSATTQTDDVIGQLLSKVDALGLRDNTLVVVFGDHGFLLGESGLWAKNQLFDQATHVPMLMHVPWFASLSNASASGQMTTRFTKHFELLDLYRTLTGFFNLTVTDAGVEGNDYSDDVVRALIGANPLPATTSPSTPAWAADAVFSEVVRCYPSNANCGLGPVSWLTRVGYTVRTPQWRYTAWFTAVHGIANFSSPVSQELYDHSHDPPASQLSFDVETYNLVATYPDVCSVMLQQVLQRFALHAASSSDRRLVDESEAKVDL